MLIDRNALNYKGMMSNSSIAAVLKEIASLLQLKGDNPYRVRAYEEAARKLEEGEIEDVGKLIETNQLIEQRGIGPSLSAKITELYQTGHLGYLDEMHGEIPPGVLEMSRVREIGPERALSLLRILDVTNLLELIDACEAHRVRRLRGFGQKTEDRIKEAARRHLGLSSTSSQRRFLSDWRPDRIRGTQLELPIDSSEIH